VVTTDNRGKIMTSKQSNGRIKRVPKLGSPKLGEEPHLPDLVLLQTKYDKSRI